MLDAASERITERAAARFEEMVEATRAGYIFSHSENATQYTRWRARRQKELDPTHAVGLTGAALERAVMSIAARDPSLVAVML